MRSRSSALKNLRADRSTETVVRSRLDHTGGRVFLQLALQGSLSGTAGQIVLRQFLTYAGFGHPTVKGSL